MSGVAGRGHLDPDQDARGAGAVYPKKGRSQGKIVHDVQIPHDDRGARWFFRVGRRRVAHYAPGREAAAVQIG